MSKSPAPVDVFAISIATAGGAGFAPIAPGTWGTAVAVPLAFLLAGVPLWIFGAVTAAVILVGIWAAGRADAFWGTHDSGRIVIDEVAGYFVTVALVDRSQWWILIVGFFVFRAFDIVKPPPVRAIDKRMDNAAGVVLDDVAAGIQGAVVMLALDYFGAFDALISRL
ncbi:MAG: phosphatidylglycerophosphatase A [Nannocystaceae bacterium]